MKKALRIILICILVLALAVGVAAAADAIFGIKILSTDKATMQPLTYFDQSISKGYFDQSISKDEADVYADAEKIEVKYTSATAGKLYMIYVLNDNSATPSENNIVYVNGATADSNGVTFTVYPSELKTAPTYYVYLASNEESGDITAITLVGTYQYVEQATTEEASLLAKIQQRVAQVRNIINGNAEGNDPRDVNGDGYINESDVSEVLDAEEE